MSTYGYQQATGQRLQNGPAYGGPSAPGEFGFCALHRRRRQLHHLIDDHEAPGQQRCDPRRECRPFVPNGGANDDVTWCTCRIHGRRRNIVQMREVGPGEYECSAPHVCHTGPHLQQPTRQPYSSQSIEMPSYPLTTAPGTAPWMPSVPTAPQVYMGGNGGQLFSQAAVNQAPPPVYQQHMHSHTASEVWCARHARHAPRDLCECVDDVFYGCRDPGFCLSAPLDRPADLRVVPRAGDILCRRHNTLRRPTYLVLSSDAEGYECSSKHPCRSVDTHTSASTTGAAREYGDAQWSASAIAAQSAQSAMSSYAPASSFFS